MGSLQAGDAVIVKSAFSCEHKGSFSSLERGNTGLVHEIKSNGDAVISFGVENTSTLVNTLTLVKRQHLSKLQKDDLCLPEPGKIISTSSSPSTKGIDDQLKLLIGKWTDPEGSGYEVVWYNKEISQS